ncbi:hypothetical protein PhaeoP72_02303 [Phaeobacter inhibens]|nr:hypothetical protein PGA1_c22510 [Phaeobacter inhibens DSM 17395]AUQ46609.1 hypothetical protein PhaeoP10_02279 [Phaeobacter inhibens]AUR04264.1 hypothetical protein PhaeoP72_02303 [Phaeobacter inhibens]
MKPVQHTWLDVSGGPLSGEIRLLLERIEKFCEARNWTLGYFGKHVAGDDTIIRRLRDTGRVQARLVLVVERFLDDNEVAGRSGGDAQ